MSAVMDVDYSPTGREFVAGSYDRSVRIFPFSGGHSREVYHTKRMQVRGPRTFAAGCQMVQCVWLCALLVACCPERAWATAGGGGPSRETCSSPPPTPTSPHPSPTIPPRAARVCREVLGRRVLRVLGIRRHERARRAARCAAALLRGWELRDQVLWRFQTARSRIRRCAVTPLPPTPTIHTRALTHARTHPPASHAFTRYYIRRCACGRRKLPSSWA